MSKNVTVYFDESSFNQDLAKLENARRAFQALLDEYNRLGFPKISLAELINLAQAGERFVRTILENQVPEQSVGLFKISRKKAVEMLELPDLSRLNTLATAAASSAYAAQDLTCNGKTVTIETKAHDSLKSSNSIKAVTSDQAKLYNAHQKLVQAMEEFNTQHYRVYGRILRDEEPIRKLIRITQESQTEMVVVDAVKKVSDRFTDKETGLPVLETIEPAHTVGKTTWMDPEVEMNEFFYLDNRFPSIIANETH